MQYIAASGDLAPAVDCLRQGGILCYPTETFYALGVHPSNEDALRRLRELKRRPDEKDLPLIAGSMEIVRSFCRTDDPRLAALASRFWPGPLTIVLPALHPGLSSYAIRVSSHPVARALSLALGAPIVSTSANESGSPPVTLPALLPDSIRSGVDVVVDDGAVPGGLPSTIVSLLTTPAQILRMGAVPAEDLSSLL